MRVAVALPALLASLGVVTCEHPRPDPAHVKVDDVSVVIVVLDAAGARYFGAYGNPLPTSPNTDALAREGGTVFTRAYAQSAWTLPSTASFLTGRYPRRRKQTRTRVEGETLATAFRQAGIVTAAFSENPYVTTAYGFERGFDEFEEYFPHTLLDRDPRFYATESARPTMDAIAWLEAHADRRTLLYLHLLTPHSPYQPPPPFGGRFDGGYTGPADGTTDTLLRINEGLLTPSPRDVDHLRYRYQENLAYGDHQVGRVLESLRRTGRLDRTIVVVTADHGEAFREHGVMLHTTTLYEEMIHVPLVIRLPPRFGKMPSRYDGIVELRDVLPTLCEAMRVPGPVPAGRSLLRALHARVPGARVARSWTSDADALALGAIVAPRRKLILDATARRLALYELASDPQERRDLAASEPARARRLARRLRAPHEPVVQAPESRPFAPETAEKLRALGYGH
jgi:arylsulfatase A-like enzyme